MDLPRPPSPRGPPGPPSPRGGAPLPQPSPRGGVVLLRAGRGRGRGARIGVSPEDGGNRSAEDLIEKEDEALEIEVPTSPTPVAQQAEASTTTTPPIILKKHPQLLAARERANAVDVSGGRPAEWKPLQQFGKPRRNSMATMFNGDPVLRMVQLLCEHSFFVEHLAHLVDSADAQRFSDALVNVSVPFGRTLFLVKAMIRSEFVQNKSQVSSILRGNCVTSKLMGSFSFFVGTKFLDKLVGDFVRHVIAQGEALTLEVDPSKESSAEKRARNRTALKELTQRLIKSMVDEKTMADIPPEFCSIAKFTADNAREYCPDNLNQLVGGYLMLRLVNPVLVAPDAYHVTNAPPSAHARRNLTLISKLLQNISNGVVSSSKEAFMADFADFVKVQGEVFSQFLTRVADSGTDLTMRPAIPVDEADVGFIEGRHLSFLHGLLLQKMDELSKALAAEPRNTLPEMELLNIVRIVKADQDPPATKAAAASAASPWLDRHLRSGTITSQGDKKRKKHKKHYRLELTRHFLYFYLDNQQQAGQQQQEGDTQDGTNGIQKCVPLVSLQCNLKQVKKDMILELSFFGKVHEFVNHETSDSVSSWHQAITAALEYDNSNPQSGNDRFIDKPSKGAVADILTAFNSIPRLAYQVSVQTKFVPHTGGMAILWHVSSFGTTWEVEVTSIQASLTAELLNKELENVVVPPLPHVLTRREGKTDYGMTVDATGTPSRGCLIFRDWCVAFLRAVQSNPQASHAKPILDLLQLNSPFRAGLNASIQHLRWIHRYFQGGLASKNKRGINVLMQIVADPVATKPEHIEMVKFLVDSRAVSIQDVDHDGNSALHRAIAAKNMVHALTLCEMGVDHTRNKNMQYPLHLAVSTVWSNAKEGHELVDACIKSCKEALLAVDDKSRTPFHSCVSRKDEETALLMLDAAADLVKTKPVPELSGPPKAALIHLALANGLCNFAKQLIQRGLVDLSVLSLDNQTLLHAAALTGDLQLTEMVIAGLSNLPALCVARDRHQLTPLLCAGIGGNVDVLKLLLPHSDQNAVDDKRRSLMHCVAQGGSNEAMRMLLLKGLNPDIVDSTGATPLLTACRSGAGDVVRTLLCAGADPFGIDSTGTTCLIAAASANSLRCCKLLIESDAADLKAVDKSKRDALTLAVEAFPPGSDNLDLITYLLSRGAKPGHVLYSAALKGNLNLATLLLKYGADVNMHDKATGSTALHVAVAKGNTPLVQLLISAGASPHIKNNAQETPLGMAVATKKKDLIILLADPK